MPSVILPGNGLLVVVQNFQTFNPFPAYIFLGPSGELDLYGREDDFFQVVLLLEADLAGKPRWEFFLEGFQETLTRGVAANV